MGFNILSPKKVAEKKEAIETKQKEETFKANNLGEYIKIPLSTGGRFDFPDIVYFKPYTTEDLTDLNASRPEDILETLIFILNKNKIPSITAQCENLLLEELLDIEAALYGTVFDPLVEYPVTCDEDSCSNDKPFYHKLNINTLDKLSIENVEDNIRESYRELFETDQDAFKDYLNRKYKGESKTIDEAISDIVIKEPLNIIMHDNNVIQIKFVRVGELARATKEAYKKYQYDLRKVNNKKYKQLSDEDAKIQKEIDFENIQISMFKEIAAGANASSLVAINGKPFESYIEKVEYYKNMPPKYGERFKENSERVKFGINHTFEAKCPNPKCGEKKIERVEHGSLLSDLIPTGNSRFNKTDKNISPEGKPPRFERVGIYF